MTSSAALLALLLAQPSFYLERPDPTREARLELVAAELSRLPAQRAAALAYQGHRESGWARYVWEGCTAVPRGAPSCDKGKARGYWQLWANTCPSAYRFAPGTAESLREEVACADRIWRNSLGRCSGRGGVAGAFAAFAGRGCDWAGGPKRAEEYETTLANLLRLRSQK